MWYFIYGDIMFKDKNLIKNIIKGIIVFLIFWYSVYWQYIPVYLFHLDVHNLSNSTKVLLSIFSGIMTLIIFLIIYFKDLKKDFKIFKKNFHEYMDVALKYWMIGLFLMMVCNFILNYVFKAGGANNEQAVQNMIKTLPWVMLFDVGILAPINEEIVFRKIWKDIFKNKYLFFLFAFILFGGAHVIGMAVKPLDYLYIFPYGILGLSFAVAYDKTDNLCTPISMHMMHNTVLCLLSIVALYH